MDLKKKMMSLRLNAANANASASKCKQAFGKSYVCNIMSHHAQIVELNASVLSDAGEYLLFYAVTGTHMSFYRIKTDQVHVLNDDGEHFENMLESEYDDWGIVSSMSFTNFLNQEE